MTFNDNSNIGNNRVRRRGRATGLAVGGGGVGVVVLFLVSQFLGVDLTGLAGGQQGPAPAESSLEGCESGADANASVDCRMGGASLSLDDFWAEQAPAIGLDYRQPEFVLFEGGTTTACGNATSATGPFYCPPDETVYVDTSFFQELRDRYGANAGPLAELYVVAHEWGHHMQQVAGSFEGADRTDTGPGSDAIRLELQADCFAGAWVAGASQTDDDTGVAYLQPPTEQQMADALSAASAVGDDRIQQASGGGVDPESWTHGSSEQRQRWFLTGHGGGVGACDTFGVPVGQL